MLIKRIRKLPFPNEYVRIVTELLRASFSDLITSRGSSPLLLPAAKNKMIDSVEKKPFSATHSIFQNMFMSATNFSDLVLKIVQCN